jgi:hypothetical protein
MRGKRRHTRVLASWILAAVVASACSQAPVAETGPEPGERFSLRAGESASIRGERATIAFERILSDSRCAIDVQCIWAGEARGAFRLEKRGEAAVSFELDTDRDPVREVGGYRVSLLAVSPAPRSTVRIAPADYRVELTVSR